MTMRLSSAAAAAAILSFAVIVSPTQADIPITINGGVGYWLFDTDHNLDDGSTPWISAEWAFTDHWAGELFYSKDSTGLDRDIGSADVSTWELNALYYGGSYIGSTPRLRPYALLGVGELDIDAAGPFDSTETTLNAGVGVRWMMSSRFGARLETKVVQTVTGDSATDYLLSAGVNYYFGNVQPAVVMAAAPVDSDGDGVTDDRDQCPGTAPGTRVDSVGCPIPVTQVASIKLKVNFAFDSDDVQEHYFADIAELAAFLKRFDDLQVDVEGHSDSQGDDGYNLTLSERRAQAVVDLLVNEHGISSSRLNAVGFGESSPVASNDNMEGRAENRRVMATLEVEFEEE